MPRRKRDGSSVVRPGGEGGDPPVVEAPKKTSWVVTVVFETSAGEIAFSESFDISARNKVNQFVSAVIQQGYTRMDVLGNQITYPAHRLYRTTVSLEGPDA